MEAGYIQVYTGNGKGKTTASIGLVARAAGRGLRCFVGQFMKGQGSGELELLQRIEEVTVEQFGGPEFVNLSSPSELDRRLSRKGVRRAVEVTAAGAYSLVVLDEINVALSIGLLSMEEINSLFDGAARGVEIVCTGRYAPEELIARADLVTEFVERKHYEIGRAHV